MKHVILILALAFFSCSDDDDPTDKGCLTGVPKGQTERILIKCSTHDQYLAGSNTGAGGTSAWDSYSGHKWEKCGDCK